MLVIYNKKVEIEFKTEDKMVLDGQSRILNWLFNQLLSICQDDYKKNNNGLNLLSDRNLRNYVTQVMKKNHPFLNTVHSSPIKEVSARIKDAYQRMFNGQNKYPRFRSWKRKWYSLYFDEPNKGWVLQDDKILIMLGNIPDMPKIPKRQNPGIYGKLKEKVVLGEDEKINTFRLCKQQGNKFYGIFTIERGGKKYEKEKELAKQYKEDLKKYNVLKKKAKTKEEKEKLPNKPENPITPIPVPIGATWVALDPNHKNFFVAVDHKGNSFEWKKLTLIKYWDKKIDKLKSLRDVCEKNYRKRQTKFGNTYTVHSPRWNRINKALNNAYHCRREQIKTLKYTVANELFNQYDVVIIGDYTPTNGTAPFDNMKRSMLNQEIIGDFRKTLEWVAKKRNKFLFIANEHNTTKECCACGHKEKKDPSIREFKCVSCGKIFMRDNNSAVNIGKKEGFILDEKHLNKLSKFMFKAYVPLGKKPVIAQVI